MYLEIHIMGDENWAIHSFNKHLNLHTRDCLFHIQIFYNHLIKVWSTYVMPLGKVSCFSNQNSKNNGSKILKNWSKFKKGLIWNLIELIEILEKIIEILKNWSNYLRIPWSSTFFSGGIVEQNLIIPCRQTNIYHSAYR